MLEAYTVDLIRRDQIDQAYVLMRLIASSLSLERWRDLCSQTILQGNADLNELRTIVVAANPLGYIQGLYLANVREDALHGRILETPAFIVTSAADERGVSAALFDHLRAFAQRSFCHEIHVWTLGMDNWERISSHKGALDSRPGLVIAVEPGKLPPGRSH